MTAKERYEAAREQYAALGIDTDAALQTLKETPVSMHCWQGDDVGGFEHAGDTLSGGDHVTILNDDMRMIGEEVVRTGELDRIHLGTDFFDGSINRIGAWAIGTRATKKALLWGLLQNTKQLVQYEEDGNYFARLALNEQFKTLPFGDVWNYFCESENVPDDNALIGVVLDYEKNVLSKRA